MEKILFDIINSFKSISLDECKDISVNSRKETKYICNFPSKIVTLLWYLKSWSILSIEGKSILKYKTSYYDTENKDMYNDQINKKSVRQKVRIREYENSTKFLEIKEKKNGITKKTRKLIENNTIDFNCLKDKCIYDINSIYKITSTEYNRITLVNKDSTTRITIDFDIIYNNYINNRNKKIDNIIIEVKSKEKDSMDFLFNQLGIQKVKYSKYKNSVEI